MKPLFLDNPPRYTRIQNELYDPIRYASGIYQVRPLGHMAGRGGLQWPLSALLRWW